MEILDGTVVAPAAPHIGADAGVPAVDVNVAISAYVLTLAVLIPLSGWLSVGRERPPARSARAGGRRSGGIQRLSSWASSASS